MSRVIIFSRNFPAYHPRKGEPTYFVEKILIGLGAKNIFHNIQDLDQLQILTAEVKGHTIRKGNRWKVGDKFSPRVWSGKPYASKQIIIAPDIEVKKVWDIYMVWGGYNFFISTKGQDKPISVDMAAKNDGLVTEDFINWFCVTKKSRKGGNFSGQIICWNENINY